MHTLRMPCVFVEGCMRETKISVVDVVARLKVRDSGAVFYLQVIQLCWQEVRGCCGDRG